MATLCASTVEPWRDAAAAEATGFDRVWSYATLYEKPDDRYLQKFALTGRLQADSAWVDADQGQFDDIFTWRRFRFGFKAELFHDWTLHVEADFDLNESLGDMYTRLTDAYIGWSPTEYLDLTFLKQSVGFTLDGATSSKNLLTMQRNNLSNNLWFTNEYFTGIDARGKIDSNWRYRIGVFSSDGSDELSRFDASYFTRLSFDY